MNGPFKKSSAAPARKSTSHTVEPKAAKRGAAADDADDDESARARRLEEVELENCSSAPVARVCAFAKGAPG